jgi:lipoyl-dependent peroxiredoxin
MGRAGRAVAAGMTTPLVKPLYTARATATGGRSGHAVTDDGQVDVHLKPPKEMGGSGDGTNPEQLFATGYAACFQSALAVVGRRQGVNTEDSLVEADVTIGTTGNGQYGLAVTIKVSVPGVPADTVAALAQAAHQVCPYSNATRGNIEVTLESN